MVAANTYLHLGQGDYGASNNGKFMIGFGYVDYTAGTNNTHSPAYIGYEETSTSGDTKGDLTFYTRNVTTDSVPTQRMTINDDGKVGIGTTSPDSHLHISSSVSSATPSLHVEGSGSSVVEVDGTNGRLFSVTDEMEGSIFSANTIAGLPVIEAKSDYTTHFGGDVLPSVTAIHDLGSDSKRWNTVYTSDLSLKNEKGDWTFVEGEDDLYIYNNKKDKVYKFNLTEVDSSEVPPKRSG